ncbi:Reverse transcriptase, RNA-dependent DNA polymerase [Gossypium australe]|uniref:Reverse transcriptase, RNA-dependent DNA polymerase n=1 Tax=Gossypium australe TaxID=47621 RepID=A0A5B6VB09_9ROSI|nr:Reverse transcriptase, RNA-dependent DNA polymerase [Gossypium australe]
MITFLEDCVSHYRIFWDNEAIKKRKHGSEHENRRKESGRERFAPTALPLRCVSILYTGISKTYFQGRKYQDLETLLGLLNSLETCLFFGGISSEEVEDLLLHSNDDKLLPQNFCDPARLLCSVRILKALRDSLSELKLPRARNDKSLARVCFQAAALLVCTACSSYKLYKVKMKPLSVLVIDEAAQLKECESAIPLQLPGLAHSILIGDEWQLQATVQSNVSNEAGFGRSLFPRLTTLGHSKHPLDIQYRMHPLISCLPNACFYNNKILDAADVKHKSYERHYLPWPMFGPFSFINVCGREEEDGSWCSHKNMVEVAVLERLVQTLLKAWKGSRKRLSIGIISPYASQVVAIQEKLGRKYEKIDGFAVKVKSVDGFQGVREQLVSYPITKELMLLLLGLGSASGFWGMEQHRPNVNLFSRVRFSDNFRKSFGKVKSTQTQKSKKNEGTYWRQQSLMRFEDLSLEEESGKLWGGSKSCKVESRKQSISNRRFLW